PQGVQGLFSHYLYLRNQRDGNDKILVPILPLASLNFPSTETALLVEPPEPFIKTYRVKAERSLPCLTFTVTKEGSLTAENNTGLLYLALLAVQKKDYDQAFHHLEELNRAIPLDKIGLNILKGFLKHKDSHPNSLALILKAATFVTDDVTETLEPYLNALDKVSTAYRLPLYELTSLLRRCPLSSLCRAWYTFITTGSWPSGITHPSFKEELDENFNLHEQEVEILTSWHNWATPKSYAAPWDVEHLQNNAETFIFTKSEYALVPWLTQITPSTWPGFFPSAYRVATSGSPVQKKLLQLQIRCCLHNTRLTLGVEQVTLLKILSAVITDPEIYPELPGDPANHGPFLGDLVKAFWDDTQAMPTALTPTPTEGPRIAEGLKGPYMPISILRTPSLEAFKCSKEIELLCTLPKAEDFFSTSLHGGYRETIRSPAALSLSPEEAVYTPHIEHSVEAFSAEISQGQESLRNVSQYTTDRAEDLKHLLSERKSALEAQDKALTVQLLEIANQTRATAEDLELEAARRQPISIESLYYLFLQRNEEAFLQENPHLKADIPRLMQMSFDSLQIKTTLQHLDRIQKALDDNELDKAGQLFAMPRNYNAQINPHYLVFEYFSDIRLYDTQVKLLEELQTKKADGTILSKVGQLMMGGGKTKVLSALLLFASARPGILPLFIVPSSLYQVVFADLSRALKSNFNRVVHPLQFTRQELTEKRCLEIEEEINFAKVSGQVVFVKSEALQVLRLQYLFECEKSLELSLGLSEKGTILGRILRIVNNESDTLIDEVHLVLAQKQEVNFPIGGKQLANARYVDMMHVFFDRLEKIPELGLKDDRQMLMSEADYKREIIPILTEAFLHSVARSPRYTAEELGRYVSGKPSKDVEDKLAADPERTLPNLAALARYTINDLFFKSFKRSCGRHFGPLPEAMALARGMEVGKIVPYQAVGTPSTTVFASWAEEAAYGFMTAFREKATMNQLTRIIDAAKYKLAEAEADDITRINEEMRALTGFTLFDLEPKENRLQALQNINTHIVQRLRLQREFLKLTIHYHDQRLSSNPQDWDLPAIRGLSGTPYNRLCYTGGLSEEERFVPDPAVEGKIVAALLKKERPLHITDTTEPEALLRSLLNADNQRRVRGFQDPGGLFKSQENLEVAKAFNKVIAGLGLEGTLFFWKKPGMAAADQIAFLRTDSEIPVPLKGSSRKDLEEQGINPDQIFIYFDERRTTGTDLPQPPNAINFTTIDILQDITSTLQSALRLRKLVSGDQAIEFVIPRDRYAKMPQDFRGIITHMVKNLAIDQSKQLYQALKQRVDSIFKKASLQALLACDSAGPVDERIALYQKLRPLMIEVTETDPFTSYGVTPESVDPDTALRQYITAKMEQYRSTGIDLHIPADLYTVLHVQKESLPLKVPSLAPQEGIEVQLEMQAEQQVEQEVQQEIQIQQEMINELQTYQRRISPLVETEFPLAAFLTPNEERPSAYSQKIVDSMAAFPSYRMSYSTCFGDEICVTSNFAPTSEGVTLMPIFYRSHKPAHQILVERKADGAFTFTLLSLAEADTIKAGSKPMPPHLWLINDMGDYLSELAHGQTNIREAPALKQALIQIAAFNGNVQYLQRYGDACLLWLNENPALTDIKKRLITMKAQLEPLQAQAVSLSNILNCAYLPSETPKVAMAVANILARGPSELPSLFAQAALSREASIPASASLKTHQSPLNASKTPPLQGPQIPAPIPRTLAFRIFFGTLSIFLMPFVLIGLLFIRPFTKAPFKDLWSWLKRPFV
ncbi:MAG: DUF3638 domain-containing protein, partial [Chlamydiota bacterium]